MADLSITAANVIASSAAVLRREYNASAAITAGQLVYLNASNQWALVDSNAAVTGNALTDTVGIALNAAANNQPLDVCVSDTDFTPGATLTNGGTVYSSVNAGAITADVPTTGAYPRVVGINKSTSKMNLRPIASGAVI
jgi:hypothetical protein